MNLKTFSILGTVSVFAAAGLLITPPASAQAAEAEEMQVLTRGPVHEAFAESVSFDPEPGIIIASQPPAAIEEMPPEQQLEGENVTWIPGYWAWDEERSDFIWISGIWRNLPPGRQWVPGYWSDADGGKSQWTSGYWSDSTTTDVSYISTTPPRNIDVGPNVEAPSNNHSWIPGNWYWAESRYVWRPGNWIPLRQNWTWVPSRYCWTRRGYVYVDGYWDYAVARRGVVFAPVYFRHDVYTRPDYYYTPSIVVALNVFSDHLFIRPRSSHYYFGDYYAPRYREEGFYTSFSWSSGHRGYDPIYAYDRWDHRGDNRWERRRQDDFNYFRDNEDARPPRTWAAMRDFREDRFNDGRDRKFATPLSSYVKETKGGNRFRALDDNRRTKIVSQRKEMKQFSEDRRQLESRKVVQSDASGKKVSSREAVKRSPIIGREAERFAKDEAPPKRPEARGDKVRQVPAGKKKDQEGIARKEEAKDPLKRPKSDTGLSPNDSKVRPDKKDPSDKTGDFKKANPKETRREVDMGKDAPQQKATKRQDMDAPKRQIEPKAKEQLKPDRQPKVTPKREIPSKPEIRKVPENRPEAAAKPKSQPKPQLREKPQPKPQATPKRESRPKEQVRQAPQKKQQVAPQRESRPKPQVREAPQPKQQVRQAPKPQTQVTPSRKSPSGKKALPPTEEELKKKKKQ